jgi:hypothetical protein
MRTLKASSVYFASVFGTGFILGAIRMTFIVPRLGVRWAELLEMPFMLTASFYFARFAVRRFGPFTGVQRLVVGAVALALMVAAELGLIFAQGQTLAQAVASRDPVSGTAYVLSLLAFAVMPWVVARQTHKSDLLSNAAQRERQMQ